jgi:hypothetical protein
MTATKASADVREVPADARALLNAAATGARHLVDFAASEAKLAALSGLAMLLLVILSAASLVIAWGLIAASVLYLLAMAGLPWPIGAVGFAVAHGVAAFYGWRQTSRLSRNLTLPELRRVVMTNAARVD